MDWPPGCRLEPFSGLHLGDAHVRGACIIARSAAIAPINSFRPTSSRVAGLWCMLLVRAPPNPQVEALSQGPAVPPAAGPAAFIRQHILDHGEAPTLTEIGDRFGLRSRATVHYHLTRMEALGAIAREPGRRRGVRPR